MSIALGAIAMTFAALLFAYAIVRVQAPSWPPPNEPALTRAWTWTWLATATIAALVGSAALRAALRPVPSPNAPTPPLNLRLLAITAAAGASFIAVQLTAWTRLAADGFRPNSGLLASVVYAMTIFHAVHAAVALGLLIPLIVRTMGGHVITPSARVAISAFWHTVTLIWLLVAVTVFVA